MRSRSTVRVADLYSGVGSLSLGVWDACRRLGLGFRCVAAVDRNADALKVFADNFQGARIFHSDICKLVDGKLGRPPTSTERAFLNAVGRPGFLLSGSPCQGFSPLNNRTRGRDERNSLYLRATRFAQLSEAENILFENVPDVLNGDLDVIGITKDALNRSCYSVDDMVVDLSVIGVPQTRRRHILVASRSKHVRISEMIEAYKVARRRSVWWAIWDLEQESTERVFDSSSSLTNANLMRVDFLRETGTYDLPNKLRPRCHRGWHSYKSMYGRLKYSEPAQTITSGFCSPGQGRFVHPTQRRTLTPHEAARLQFFPDFFDFSSVPWRTDLAEMLGNAAPSKISSVIGLNLLAS